MALNLIKGIPILGGILGGVGGALQARQANRAAEIEAYNQNVMNRYKNKLAAAQYAQEELPGRQRTRRTSTLRDRLVLALTRGGGSAAGLEKLIRGGGGYGAGSPYSVEGTAYNPMQSYYDIAGPPPKIKAARGSVLGGALGGLASGAAAAYNSVRNE